MPGSGHTLPGCFLERDTGAGEILSGGCESCGVGMDGIRTRESVDRTSDRGGEIGGDWNADTAGVGVQSAGVVLGTPERIVGAKCREDFSDGGGSGRSEFGWIKAA